MSYHDPHQEATRTPPDSLLVPKTKQENPTLEIVRFAIIALIIVLPIRWFIAQPFIVSGASMEDTFHNNEYLIVDQITYRFEEPSRGDVVIFRYPRDHSKYFIKRIVGLPGETVSIRGQEVRIINSAYPEGMILNEPYASQGGRTNHLTETLGSGEYFVLGDNRDHSSDSRVWGVLKRDEIIGRAILRLFPPNKASYLPGHSDHDI